MNEYKLNCGGNEKSWKEKTRFNLLGREAGQGDVVRQLELLPDLLFADVVEDDLNDKKKVLWTIPNGKICSKTEEEISSQLLDVSSKVRLVKQYQT